MTQSGPSRLFKPLMAGASLRDRMIGSAGALLGIGLAGLICGALFPASMPWLIAPMGASAVLLFAVPSSPLAQPWSIIGGNSIAAIVGILVANAVSTPAMAAALAVATAILVMSLLRCLHRPGGAVALSAVLGWSAIGGHVIDFLVPVAINSAVLVGVGMTFHRFSGHSYPHRARPVEGKPSVPAPVGVQMADIDAALEDLGETFDISREDLALLLERAEVHAKSRIEKGQAAS